MSLWIIYDHHPQSFRWLNYVSLSDFLSLSELQPGMHQYDI